MDGGRPGDERVTSYSKEAAGAGAPFLPTDQPTDQRELELRNSPVSLSDPIRPDLTWKAGTNCGGGREGGSRLKRTGTYRGSATPIHPSVPGAKCIAAE